MKKNSKKNKRPEAPDSGIETAGQNSAPSKPSGSKRIVASFRQAHAISTSIKRKNLDSKRIKTMGVTSELYDGKAPFDQDKQERSGQAWRSNYSTHFMATVVDRVAPQIADAAKKSDTYTSASLPSGFPDGAAKSRKFREEVTKLIRGWTGWDDFMSRLAHSVTFHGGAIPVRTGSDWRPELHRPDEIFVPPKAGQHSQKVPMLVIRHQITLKALNDLIEGNQQAVEYAGYEPDAIKKIIETASHSDSDGGEKSGVSAAAESRAGMDDIDETSISPWFLTLMVLDYSGEIDIWTTAEKDGTGIRSTKSVHLAPEHAMAVFTMQPGDGTFHGSKGLGRMIANLHTAIERGRCMAHDSMFLAGTKVLKGAYNGTEQFTMVYPWLIVPDGFEPVESGFSFDIGKYLEWDNKLTSITESIAGAFIPPNIDNQGSSRTKIEAAQKAERELAVRGGVIGRFSSCFSHLISMMKAGIFSEENLTEAISIHSKKDQEKPSIPVISKLAARLIKAVAPKEESIIEQNEDAAIDREAVAMIVRLLEAGLTVTEIAVLAHSPASSQNQDATADSSTLQFIAANKSNPFVNQKAASVMEARLSVGDDRAEALLNSEEEDAATEAAQSRQQILEFVAMMSGEQIPVSPLDNHKIHRMVLSQKLDALMGAAEGQAADDSLIATVGSVLAHYRQHIESDQMTSKEEIAQEASVIKELESRLERAATSPNRIQPALDAAAVEQAPPQPGVQEREIALKEEKLKVDAVKVAADMMGKQMTAKEREIEEAKRESENLSPQVPKI